MKNERQRKIEALEREIDNLSVCTGECGQSAEDCLLQIEQLADELARLKGEC